MAPLTMSDPDPVLVPAKAIAGVLLLLLLSAMPRVAGAQTGSPAAMPVYVYGHADTTFLNAGIASVRRRIAQIGWSRAGHRNGSPMFIIIPRSAPVPDRASEGQQTAVPSLERQSEPGNVDPSGLVADEEESGAALAEGAIDQEALAAAVAEGAADREEPSAADAERAADQEEPAADTSRTVQQLETVLLETGFFATADVHFEIDRSALLPSSRKILDIVGEFLLRHAELRIEVSGHTDSVGDTSYNQELSESRAVAVRDYLLLQAGIEESRVSACSYGEERPVANNATFTGRALNRRVEFRVVGAEDQGPECRLQPDISILDLQRQ